MMDNSLYRFYNKMIKMWIESRLYSRGACLPIYTSKKFGALTISSCAAGALLLVFITWSIFSFFSIRRVVVYYQLVNYDQPTSKPSAAQWARLNHTILILDNNIVESLFTVFVKGAPPYQDVTIETNFDDPWTYTNDDPAPQILEGNQSWSGRFGEDLHVNQTLAIHTKLRFDFDAKYCISGQALSYDCLGGSSEGLRTIYYVTVEQGKIVKVTDEQGQTPSSTEIEANESSP